MKYVICSLIITYSCSQNDCNKVPLSKNELEWFRPYSEVDTLCFQANKELIDSFYSGGVDNEYTTCNKFEFGDFIYNESSVELNHKEASKNILIYFSKSFQDDTLQDCFKRFKVFDFTVDLANGKIPDFKTVFLNGENIECAYFRTFEKNRYIQQFYWSKELGLIRYVTKNGEIYDRRW